MTIRPIHITGAFTGRDFWSLKYIDAAGVVSAGGTFATREKALAQALHVAKHYRGVTVSA